jgi:hypothetical protein
MTTFLNILQVVARWLARGIGTLAAAVWLLIMLDILACDLLVGFVCLSWETVLLVVIAVFSMLSVIIAWWREGIGGCVMLVWGLTFTIIAYVTSRLQHVYSMLITGVPFIIAGFLFLVSWRFQEQADTDPRISVN